VAGDGLRAVHHNGGTHGVSTVLALVPEENLAVAVLSNTHSPWPEAIMIEILQALLPGRLRDLPASPGAEPGETPFVPAPELAGLWRGLVHTSEGEIPLVLEIGGAGSIHATLGEGEGTLLRSVSYRQDFPLFLNAGGGPFLRGTMPGELGTEDVVRGQPAKLWLELKLRDNVLNGSLIALSQRQNPAGPLAHWVELRRGPPE
jgi:hypothetical protein